MDLSEYDSYREFHAFVLWVIFDYSGKLMVVKQVAVLLCGRRNRNSGGKRPANGHGKC